MKNIYFRDFTDNDIEIFGEWLKKSHIKKWYEPIEEWLEEVRNREGNFSWIKHFIVMCENVPIGFCQYYDCFDSKPYEDWNGRVFNVRGEIFSIDYLIGNEDFLGKGYGKEIVRLLTEKVFSLGAKEIIVDPDKENALSNAVLLKNNYVFSEIFEQYSKIMHYELSATAD